MAQSNLHHHESQVWTEVWRGGGGATGSPGLEFGGGVGEGAAAGWVSRKLKGPLLSMQLGVKRSVISVGPVPFCLNLLLGCYPPMAGAAPGWRGRGGHLSSERRWWRW